MKDSIEAIQHGLRTGRFVNEATVSQGIVLRVLSDLAWPTYDTNVVSPEYSLHGRRVDYALCHPPTKPIVFIEVKQVGQGSDAERQLFEYAFLEGVPLAVLTTGQEWHFFLPAERGDFGERRVYKLDLLERDTDECIARLRRYLDYQSVSAGTALEDARSDYRSIAREREILRTMPEAWLKLVEDGDELLLELVAEKVESLCGFRPLPDTVADFLAQGLTLGNRYPATPASRRSTAAPSRSPTPPTSDPAQVAAAGIGFVLNGQTFAARSARDLLVQVFQQLAERDEGFLERFSARTAQRRKRRYLATTREGLYPGNERLASEPSHARELFPGSGWWIDLNLSRRSIAQVLEVACEVAGLQFGVALKLSLDK